VCAVLILRLLLGSAPKAWTCFLWLLCGLRLTLPFSLQSGLSLQPKMELVSPLERITVTASSSTGTAVLEYEIVILGDLSGDGYVDAFDSAKIMEYYFGATLTDIQKIAADVSRDDSIDSFDAAKIMNKYFDNYESSLGA
jgi:hypothetical protein